MFYKQLRHKHFGSSHLYGVSAEIFLDLLLRARSLDVSDLRSEKGRVAWWLATCARKPKVPGSSPAASYAQR